MGSHIADLVVVGLGGSGLTAIIEAAKRGLSVIGIDADRIGGGAAGRNGGFLMAGPSIPYDEAVNYLGHVRAHAWYGATDDLVLRMQRDFPEFVTPSGSLTLATDKKQLAYVQSEYEALKTDGFAVSWYKSDDGEGFISEHDAIFNPLRRCEFLADVASRMNVRLAEGTPALEISENLVRIPSGEIHARAIIVAVDGNLERVLPQLRGRVRSTRLQMLSTAPMEWRIPFPTYARNGFDYYWQLPTGEIALGGCRDKHMDEEWGAPAEISDSVQADLDALVAKLTNKRAKVTNRWAGVVSYTSDHLAICERMMPSVYAIGAYCGLGNVMGPLCGIAVVSHMFGDDRLYNIVRSDVRSVPEEQREELVS